MTKHCLEFIYKMDRIFRLVHYTGYGNFFADGIQWGAEYQTSLVFILSKRCQMPNGPVFNCHLNIGQMNAIWFSYVLSCFKMVGPVHRI